MSTKTKLISIKSVLYDLSEIIPKRYWNETRFYEWAVKGLLRVDAPASLEEKVELIPIGDHVGSLPDDFKYLIQAVAKLDVTDTDLADIQEALVLDNSKFNASYDHMNNPTGLAQNILDAFTKNVQQWVPLRLASNPFHSAILCDPSPFTNLSLTPGLDRNRPNCENEYRINPDLTITTTFKDGYVLLAYLRSPQDKNGDFLIPDVEELKEAIFHYCMWRFWLVRSTLMEPNAPNQRDYHRAMWGLMKAKAVAKLTSPTIDQLENIKNNRDKLLNKTHAYDSLFSTLGQKEINNF